MVKNAFLTLWLLLTLSPAVYAQLAVVSSNDGYANVRTQPNMQGEIVTPLQNNTVVLLDGIYAAEYTDTKWQRVYFSQDPYCMACTPDLTHHMPGFIHKSQLKPITELNPVDRTVFNMSYTIAAFNPSTKRITHFDDNSTAII